MYYVFLTCNSYICLYYTKYILHIYFKISQLVFIQEEFWEPAEGCKLCVSFDHDLQEQIQNS